MSVDDRKESYSIIKTEIKKSKKFTLSDEYERYQNYI